MKKLQYLSLLFLLGGIGIIVAIFFLFLQEYQEPNLFYLNLIATCLVFAVNFVCGFDIFGTVENVAKVSSGYGLKWYGIWLYTPLAITLIICSICYEIGFNICLIGHLILLFILLGFFFLATVVHNNTNDVASKINARKAGLRDISLQADLLEIQCKLKSSMDYMDGINDIKEQIRYITASDNPLAIELETQIASKIRLLTSQIEHSSQTSDKIKAGFAECMSLIELRKKQY